MKRETEHLSARQPIPRIRGVGVKDKGWGGESFVLKREIEHLLQGSPVAEAAASGDGGSEGRGRKEREGETALC